jgi:hypothetical protein
MNKEALKSIYAYNMLFNNSSGSINTDGDVKLNTHLISDFDLQNFNPKRFEYYTTLLKMFDNDPETLSNVLNKYYSVKSLKAKERKLIREINDYVNKINKKTVGGAVGGGGDIEADIEKLIELYRDFELKPQDTQSKSNIPATPGAKTASYKPLILQTPQSEQKPKPSIFSNASKVFKNAIEEFNKNNPKTKEGIDEFEESIKDFEQTINNQSGGSGIDVKKFITNMKTKEGDKDRIQIPDNILNMARDIIKDARKEVKSATKDLKKATKESDNKKGSLKTQVFGTKGVSTLVKEPLKKKAEASYKNTQNYVKEADIISAKALALEAYAKEYAAYANLQVEEAEGEYEKAQAVLASLPKDTRVNVEKIDATITKVRKVKIERSKIEVYDAFKKREKFLTSFNELETATGNQTPTSPALTVEKIANETNIPNGLTDIRGTKPVEQTLAKQEYDDADNAKKEQTTILNISNGYLPIDGHAITNIKVIQDAVRYTKTALDEAINEANRAKQAAVSATTKTEEIKVLVEKMNEEERKTTKLKKEGQIGQELAKKSETVAKTFIEKARVLITEVEADKIYAHDRGNSAGDAFENAKIEADKATNGSVQNDAKEEADALTVAAKAKEEAAEEEEADKGNGIHPISRVRPPPLLLTTDKRGLNSSSLPHRRMRRTSLSPRVLSFDSSGGASPEEKYSDDTLKAQYLDKSRYRSISPRMKQEFRDVRDSNKGNVVRIKTDNKIDQLSNDIDIYNALSVEDREDNADNIIKKIKDFENDPQNPLEELEITLDDRIVFIIATFFIRYITLLMVQWCIDINIITSFYEGFIYYAIIYIILFWFVVLFINIDNSYDVKYMNFNGIINSIRSLFYYFYMGTNGISRLFIHTSLIILLIVIPIILNIKKKPEFKDEANDEPVANVKILTYDERKQLSKTLTLFTMFIWLFTSIIATKF